VTRYLSATVLTLSIVLLIVFASVRIGKAANSEQPSVQVQVTKLQKGGLPKTVTVFGKIQATEGMRQDVTAPSTAVVEGIFTKPGERVDAGTALIRLGPTPGTSAAYKKAKSALNNARDLLQRTQTMLAQHLATRQQVADAQKAVSDAEASLSALTAEGASTPKTLSASSRGVVTGVSATLGEIVSPGSRLLSIAHTSGLVLQAGAVPELAEQIKAGDTANVSALGGGDAGSGTVLLSGAIIDPSTGLVPIEISVPPATFLAGQSAQAHIVTGTVDGYVVPHEAVLVDDHGSPYVVQAKNMIAHDVPIKILLSAGAKDVITGALDPQAALVLAGNYQAKDGMQVRIVDPTTPGIR
jgi:membrane fusion protein (multidrug efflux system)